ncbi:transcription elongation factor SPT6 [Octopus bimaculoides]|uniref:Transcription elongation factor SPT6 n=1 Tax=Octopus bimaculoides TaxID=37653 RepID=A0A0L8FSW1_OCTBM|nr:transcription elongation factor SPT6 [Octopus bimaculoides]|eukprot:XP_014787232.1 PREDICTED: transcription elongation factor SPT6-like [Octopus bimaculoides]
MDFFEQEAEVSSDSDDSSLSDSIEIKKKKKEVVRKKRTIDDDDEEEEEDDEEKLAEEMKDLINDDVEEEESDDNDSVTGKRKHDSDIEDDDQLEEDDYDLIEENLGIKVSRKQKRKRIRVASDDDDSDREDEESKTDAQMREIANTLFDDDEEEEEDAAEDSAVPASEREEEPKKDDLALDIEGSDEEESDIDDFIVDDEGQPISKGKKKKPVIHTDKSLQIAQDIFGVDFDFADLDKYDEEEDEEDYEDEYEEDLEEGEAALKTKKAGRKRTSKKSIYEIYEPSELERGHFTDLDNEIRTVDVPERFQLRQIRVTQTEEGELDEEAEWIYKQAFTTKLISKLSDHGEGHNSYYQPKSASAVNKIRDALNFMRNHLHEVPFIAFYRKEYVEPDLNINDLWRVWEYDEKWSQLRQRKQNLVRLFEKMQNFQFEENSDPDKVLETRPLTSDDVARVKKVQTLEELRDCYQHFLLHYGSDIPKMRNMEKKKKQEESNSDENAQEATDTIKQATRKTGYDLCLQAKLDDIAQKFGLTPEQFGENLRDNYQRHEVDQYPGEPSELAKDLISGQFPTEEDVLMGARHIVAMQIAHDPLVRQCIRSAYFERAKIKVRPTKKGMKEIDESHPCYSCKYLRNKPVIDLKDDAFVKLSQAEEDGLLVIEFSMDNFSGNTQTYFKEIQQLYYRDEFSKLVQQWNNQRSQALERALNKILYPQMEKEIRAKLLKEGKDFVLRACCRKLHNYLKVAPYQADQQLEDDYDYDDNSNGLKVMGVAYSTSWDIPSFAVIIDGNGQVTDFLRLQDLTKRRNAWRQRDKELKERDVAKLKKFISSKKPHVVAVSGESRESLMIIDDIKAIISELEQEQDMPPINVELVEHDLALVYENSNRATTDFREYPSVLRHAISIARRLQDPLVEFASLCNADEDILCLKYHPLQDCIVKEDLLNGLHLEFINRVNEVGVDVNQALDFPHHASLLQFVCGLGPRKGSHLIRILKQNNSRLENRTQLVTVCHMGPKVFINCSGFIKIDTSSLGDSTEAYVEVLDGSRVHPETYEWARKMAVDALEYDDTAEDANPAGALEEILESPERLKDLDLDAFAEELNRQGYGNKHITLYDIRAELNHRYKDLRTSFRSPSNEEKFNMLTKETPQTFYAGKLVLCGVTGIARKRPQGDQLDEANPVRNEETGLWQCPFCQKKDFPELSEVWSHFDAGNCPGSAVGVKVRLDNSVSGFIPTKMISDKMVTNPEDRVKIGQTLHCRITKIDIDRFQVELTCRSSDLRDKENNWKPQRDLYFDYEAEKSDAAKEEEKRKVQARQTYIKRVIVHPAFHNISFKECEKLMANYDQGEVIIRPSSKGADHLTVTLKSADDVLQHIDVREEGKENAFSLGRSLWIGNMEFEDLDEIIARYIQPMASFARDIMHFKYYKEGVSAKKDVIDKYLIDEKKKAPSRIPYVLTASPQYPGKFMLSYLPRNKPRHEYITILPDGLRYRSQTFHSLNSMIRWFKEHFREPIPGTPSSSSRTPAPSFTTPALSMQGVDAATIHRAAAGLPNNIYNTLAQVATGTPQHIGSNSNYTGAYSGGNYYQPMATPMMTPMLTPSYHSQTLQATPAHSLATPSYQPTPRSAIWPGATPSRTPQRTQPRPTTSSTDWAKAAEMWAKRKQSGASTPKPGTPRHGSSPAVRSVPNTTEGTGDATPLIDER